MEEEPWPEWKHGKAITPRQIAFILKPFGIKPRLIRFGIDTARGYDLVDLDEPLRRYLPNDPLQALQPNIDAGLGPLFDPLQETERNR